jgi:hypothetical protein
VLLPQERKRILGYLGPHNGSKLIEIRERAQMAKYRFYRQNPMPPEEELAEEEGELMGQIAQRLPLYGLQNWSRARKIKREADNQ